MQRESKRGDERRRREGMTLIEVMVVMVIMTAIAAAAAIGVMRQWEAAKVNDTKTRARTIQSAATMWLLEGGDGCPEVSDLARENILDATTQHTDGWGNAFVITCEGATVHVKSGGRDETLGTEDDLGF